MKRFIFLTVFAIGLMFALPAESSGSKAPPGQEVGFFQELKDFQVLNVDFTGMVGNLEVQVFEVPKEIKVSYNAMVIQEGGFVVVRDSYLESQAIYLNDKNATFKATANNLMENNDFRLCRYTRQNESQRLISNDTESRSRCTIRADSQG